MTAYTAGWFIIAQIPLLIVIIWLLNQLNKQTEHLRVYADLYGKLAGHDVVAAREYVRAMSDRAADAEIRAENMKRRNPHPMAATVEEEEGMYG